MGCAINTYSPVTSAASSGACSREEEKENKASDRSHGQAVRPATGQPPAKTRIGGDAGLCFFIAFLPPAEHLVPIQTRIPPDPCQTRGVANEHRNNPRNKHHNAQLIDQSWLQHYGLHGVEIIFQCSHKVSPCKTIAPSSEIFWMWS